MRPVIMLALLGTTLSMHPAVAQNSPEQPASGTAEPSKKHSGTSGTDALTENAPERPNALVEAHRRAAARSAAEEAPVGSVPPAQAAPEPIAPAVHQMVQAVPPGPPQKNLTGQEFALIQVGATAKQVLEVLGPPSSRVTIPDDDGHLRESLQYWVKGSPMGTVRLDNGRVVQIETRPGGS
jgi:hypothetical protein